MHDDFFAWVRLTLLIIIFLAFAFWCNLMEDSLMNQQVPEEPVQKQPIHIAQEQTPAIIPLNTEPAAEPTIRKPLEEITPPTEAATEPPTEPETEPTYTAEELEILALIIYQEAGADWCSNLTRLMVGTVVMNRIADPRFPDTMYDVATEERAYGSLHWTGIVWPSRASHSTETHAVERAYEIAERILQGERALPADVIFQSEYIMGEIVAYSDGLYFCR